MAAVTIRLSDGGEFVVYMSREDLTKEFRAALDENRLLEVTNGDGRVRVVNPHQVLYFEDAPDERGEANASASTHSVQLTARH